MGAFEFAKDTLVKMRLSQLRELARRLGVARYSGMLREQLVSAIQSRASRLGGSDALPTMAPALESSLPSGEAPDAFASQEPPPTPVVPPSPVDLPTSGVGTPGTVGTLGTVGTQAPEDPAVAAAVLSSTAVPAPGSPAPVLSGTSVNAVSAAEVPSSPATPAWIVLLAEGPQWAKVRWDFSAADRERALAAGGQQLALRLTDVTDTADGGAHRHTLQEVLVEAGAREWHLPVPLGDRDYRVELGYRTTTGGWYPLVLSSVVRMPAELELPIETLAPFSLVGGMEPEPQWLAPLASPGLHERLYQQASSGRIWTSQGSEGFHELGGQLAGAAGGHLSGVGQGPWTAGPWASGREASGAGMAPRQRSFWLVADAELIVYGATDPSATLTVGDHRLPLAEDGTFSLHTAFPDGEQNYPIKALAADGEQKRSITLDFSRVTPHAQVNPKESAVPEWF